MAATEVEIARILLIAVNAAAAEDPTHFNQRVRARARAIGMQPEAFEIAARLLTDTADEYFDRQAEVGRILEAVRAPVRIEVVRLNEREVSAERAKEMAEEEGAHAFVMRQPEGMCPYTGHRRALWLTGWRRMRDLSAARSIYPNANGSS